MKSRRTIWVVATVALGLAGVIGLRAGEAPEPSAPTAPPAVAVTTTNLAPAILSTNEDAPTTVDRVGYLLASARFAASTRDFAVAEGNFVKLLAEDTPEDIQKTALFEMALVVQAQSQFTRAQSIFTQYAQRWPGDSRLPEICLHQGQIFRQMGLHDLALTKFYAVMSAALTIKNDQLPVFKRLVLQAQVEIAETHYLMGKFKDAADYYGRLLKQNDPALDRTQIQFRLVRSLVAVKQFEEAATQAQDFLAHYSESPDAPEVRYDLAESYKGQGRNAEALQQVLVFLKEERAKTLQAPETWIYWQQRVGNEIANELYQEGDFVRALEVYQTLVKLDAALPWQLPVQYQVGITYEKLLQPVAAIAAYRTITNAAPQLGTNLSPGLKSVVGMARWRLNFLEWQRQAENFNHPAGSSLSTGSNTTNLILSQK